MSQKAALVTGGARRLGRALALALARDGYDIALHYRRSRAEADITRKEVLGIGVDCDTFACDLSDDQQLFTLIPRVFQRFSHTCVLINSASIFQRGRLEKSTPELFDAHFQIHVKAPFFLIRDFARFCASGQIINVLDTKISRNLIEYFPYTLSKKALYDLTRMAARELAPRIQVNGIAPGNILPSSDIDQEAFEQLGKTVPMQTTGDPEDIVSAARFLLQQSFITGDILFVDGGEHLK